MALNTVDVNNYIRANKQVIFYLAHNAPNQYSIQNQCSKTPKGTLGEVFVNEVPDGTIKIREIKQQQKRHFSENEIKEMVTDYTKHRLTVYQLADKFGCNRTTVSKMLKNNGVTVTNNRMDETIIGQATALYASGLTLKAVGEHLGICESTVRKTLVKAGVEMRKPHRYIGKECKRQNKQGQQLTEATQ